MCPPRFAVVEVNYTAAGLGDLAEGFAQSTPLSAFRTQCPALRTRNFGVRSSETQITSRRYERVRIGADATGEHPGRILAAAQAHCESRVAIDP